MQINRVNLAATSFRGATLEKSGRHIKEMCLSDETSKNIDNTIKALDAISDQFKRNVTVTLSTPPKAVGAYTIEVTDNKDKTFHQVGVLLDDRKEDENKELNRKALSSLEWDTEDGMRYHYASGYDREGKPILWR